jgi:5-methyltetrahydrofolate--homocysteine methyltransferase
VRSTALRVVVMAFDEKGQADTLERASRSAARYRLLTERSASPEDIIFDPEHLRRRDRARGARALRARLHRGDALDAREPAARAGLGRRLQPVVLVPRQRPVREAMHTAFLYHAIQAGMTMGIVNAGQLGVTTRSTRSCASGSRT